jgi:tetratricopeptide (TPR) repeat protein
MTDRFHYLKQLLEASPKDAFVLFALAKEFEGQGDSQKALEFYLRLKEANPNYVGLYYHLGKLYEKLDDSPKAIDTYKKGIEVSQKAGDRHAASELAGALLNLEDPDEI